MVHGREPLEQEIPRFSSPIQQAFKEGAWLTVLMGTGMGIILPSLIAYLEKNHRGEPKGILCLEQEPGLICAGLSVYDYSDVLKTGRILFALGPNLVDSLESICDANHLETLDPSQIRVFAGYFIDDPERKEDYEHALKSFKKYHEEKRKHYFDLLRKAEVYWSSPSENIQKIWTHLNDDRGDGGILLGLSEGFKEIGLDSKALFFKDRLFTRFYRCAYDFFSFQPDLILCINHSSNYVASFTQNVPIPRLIWYVDHPRNTVEVPYHPNDYAVGISESFSEEIEHRGGRFIGVVPAASKGMFQKPNLNSNWKHNVSYVGSVIDYSSVLQAMDKTSREWVETVVETQIEEPMKPLSKIMADFPPFAKILKELSDILKPHISKAIYMSGERIVGYFLYAEANTRRRIRFMAGLRNHNQVGIYGPPDWQNLLPNDLQMCYLGPIDTSNDLGELYRSSKVNLSINSLQGYDFLNPRIFEVPSAGGFLLAEWVPGIERFFEPEKELYWFDSMEGMLNSIDNVLEDEGKRLAVISRAQKRIQAEHLYKHRAEQILNYLSNIQS